MARAYAVNMRAFLRRRRRWLLQAALLVAVSRGLLFLARDPDGSEAALKRVRVGMTVAQVKETIFGIDNLLGVPSPVDFPSSVSYGFADHTVCVVFDSQKGVANKFRMYIRHRPTWWQQVSAYLDRVRAAVGL
jgi:hypothetical protein